MSSYSLIEASPTINLIAPYPAKKLEIEVLRDGFDHAIRAGAGGLEIVERRDARDGDRIREAVAAVGGLTSALLMVGFPATLRHLF